MDWLKLEVAIAGDPPFFRYDVFPEATPQDNFSLYCEIQEELRRAGWEIRESCIEHDCVSGPLSRVEPLAHRDVVSEASYAGEHR